MNFGLWTRTLDYGLWTSGHGLWTRCMQSTVLGTPGFVILIEYRSGHYMSKSFRKPRKEGTFQVLTTWTTSSCHALLKRCSNLDIGTPKWPTFHLKNFNYSTAAAFLKSDSNKCITCTVYKSENYSWNLKKVGDGLKILDSFISWIKFMIFILVPNCH